MEFQACLYWIDSNMLNNIFKLQSLIMFLMFRFKNNLLCCFHLVYLFSLPSNFYVNDNFIKQIEHWDEMCDKCEKRRCFSVLLKISKPYASFDWTGNFYPCWLNVRTYARASWREYSTSVFEGIFRMLLAFLFRKTILRCWTSGSSTFPYVRKLLACFCAFFPALVILFFICIAEKLNMSMRSYFFFHSWNNKKNA